MIAVGSVHGRFQPFHNDHLEYVREAKSRCEFLWVGITKYDITPIEGSPLARARERPDHNPLTYFERITIIAEALIDTGISRESFAFVPFPIEAPRRLPAFMPTDIPCFTTIREEWNKEKIRVLTACGYQVIVLWERPEKLITGGAIRNDIVARGTYWRTVVPPATAKAVERLNLRERLTQLRQAGGLPVIDVQQSNRP
jgi:nicotinamide mononucleotide adenylyltransferase